MLQQDNIPYLPVLRRHHRHKISSVEGIMHCWENDIMATLAKHHSIRYCLFLSAEVVYHLSKYVIGKWNLNTELMALIMVMMLAVQSSVLKSCQCSARLVYRSVGAR